MSNPNGGQPASQGGQSNKSQTKAGDDKPIDPVVDPVVAPVTDPAVAALVAKLAAAEARIAAFEQERKDDELATTGAKIRAGEIPLNIPGGSYLFRVGPMLDKDKARLPTVEEVAVDESEIKRWYCLSHDDPPGSKKPVDPLKVKLQVECIDPARRASINLQKKLSAIRAKLENGHSLTEDEQKFADQHEAEVLRLVK